MSEQTGGQIATALAKAQADIKKLERNREVEVRTRSGGSYKFKYATLDHIIEHIREPLTKNGLWFTQLIETHEGKYRLVTRLLHESGEAIESHTPLLVSGGNNQEFGSALTYMRRYSLSALLGLAADDDDDGNHADGNESQPTGQPKKQKPPAQQTAPPQEQPEGYEKVLSEGLQYVAKVTSATDANAMLEILKSADHKGTSKADLWKALMDKAAVVGAVWNKDAGQFEEKAA